MQYPPERIEVADALVLRRPDPDDAEALAAAVRASLPELRSWMPWANDEAADPAQQRARLAGAAPWGEGTDFGYVIDEGGSIVGSMGLHDRIGGAGLELGYWVRTDCTGRGVATACAGALTAAALGVAGVERVEIHCDEANVRSAAIPRRLGYRLDRIEPDEIAAPGEIGRSMIWIYPPD